MVRRFAYPFFLLLVVATANLLTAEPLYLSFVTPGSGPIQKEQVTLRLEEINVPVSELLYVDNSNPSAQLLGHPYGRRLYVFVYDFIFSTPDDLLSARKTTEAFLSKIDKNSLISVAGITPREGLKVFCSPTTDRNKVNAGLNWIGLKKLEGMIEGPEGNLYPEDFSAAEKTVTLVSDAAFLQNVRSYVVSEKDKKELRPVLLQSLADLGFLLSVLDARKHIVLFSPGSDTSGLSINLPLRDKPKKKRRMDEEVAEELPRDDLDSIMDSSITKEKIDRRARAQGGVKFQKQSGETLPELIAGTDARVHIFHRGPQEHGLFKNLASRTNGNFITSEQESAAVMDRILSSDKTFYVVRGDVSTEKMKDLNTVNLQVKDREIVASSRWLIPKNAANYTSMERKVALADSIYETNSKPPSSYRFWSDFILDQNSSRIPAFVQIDGPWLLQKKAELIDLQFYAFSRDQDGDVLDFSSFIFSLDLKNKSLQEKLKTTGVKIWSVLLGNLQPATVHWTIVNLETNEMIGQSVNIDGINPAMTMTQPFFPALNLNWMVWPNPMETATKRGKEISYPYKEGNNLMFFPDFSPVLKKSVDGQVFYLRVYNLPAPDKIPPVRVSLVDSAGKANEVRTLGLLQNPTPVEPKGMGLFWRLATLPDVAPGNYQLKVSMLDPAKNQVITRAVQTHVQ